MCIYMCTCLCVCVCLYACLLAHFSVCMYVGLGEYDTCIHASVCVCVCVFLRKPITTVSVVLDYMPKQHNMGRGKGKQAY